MQKNPRDRIPYPSLNHRSFERTTLHEDPFDDYRKYPIIPFTKEDIPDAILSRLLLKTPLLSKSFRWVLYKILRLYLKVFFKVFNRIEYLGREKIPSRAIFYVNHAGTWDPIILMTAIKPPISEFLSVGIPWLEKILQRTIFSLGRHGPREENLEQMIRIILTKNRYFALWPEGVKSTPAGAVMQGYSGIARLYAALNSKRNLIPLVPVLIQGSHDYSFPLKYNTNKITVKFLKPLYLDRQWLKTIEDGGKTPREITDYLMNILARKNGQKKICKNPHLVRRRNEKYEPWEFWSVKELMRLYKSSKSKIN
jgi:1-acyl-sn-glycerol-3-phosphate acyltransferase